MFTCHLLLLIITLCVVLQTGHAFWWQPGLRPGEAAWWWGGVGWSERRWSGVEWSGVKGECKMGSVSCIFWLKAQDAAVEQQIRVSGLFFKRGGWLITGAVGGRTLVQYIHKLMIWRTRRLGRSTKSWFDAAERPWLCEVTDGKLSCTERSLELCPSHSLRHSGCKSSVSLFLFFFSQLWKHYKAGKNIGKNSPKIINRTNLNEIIAMSLMPTILQSVNIDL